jgi:MFS transporter, putative metabolite transport protein
MNEVVIRTKDDVADFVGRQPMTSSGFGVVLIALGGVFVDAYDFAGLGRAVPGLRAELSLAPSPARSRHRDHGRRRRARGGG